MLSRPMRVPSAVTQLHESPCLPPVDSMMKWRASAGGLSNSAVGTCADDTDASKQIKQQTTSSLRIVDPPVFLAIEITWSEEGLSYRRHVVATRGQQFPTFAGGWRQHDVRRASKLL